MNFRIFLFLTYLITLNSAAQADSTKNYISTSTIQMQDSTPRISNPDSIIFPRNYFNEIDFSFFKTNKVEKSVLKYIQPKKENSKHYFFLTLCIMATAMLYIKLQYQKEMQEILKSTFGNINSTEKDVSINKLLLALNFIITYIILLFFLAKNYVSKTKFDDITLLTIIAVTFCSVMFSRIVLLKFLGFIFDMQETFSKYQTTNNYINYVTGLILLPILFSEIYSHSKISYFLLCIGIFIVLINILYKIFKNILLHTQLMIYNLFHFIIYFCAVEIFPYLILNKFFREQIF